MILQAAPAILLPALRELTLVNLPLQVTVTVAMNGIPFGTKLLINGVVYTVEDRGVPYGHVDVYYDTHSQALGNGRYYADVYQLN